TASGEVRGWVGGACAEPVVVREALAAIDQGTPRLVFLGSPEELAGQGEGEGDTVLVPMSCHSEGALKIFIEPLPRGPDLVVVAPHRRTALILGSMRARGFPEEALDRLRAPAGLDLGHISHEEIAVAILAELVQFRAAGRLQVPSAVALPAPPAQDCCGSGHE